MKRTTRRSRRQEEELFKPFKRSKSFQHYAQRKFASSFPPSPVQFEKQLEKQNQPQFVEDFLQFLCVRNEPHLPPNLECFADPLINPIIIEDDIKDVESSTESDDLGVTSLNVHACAMNPKVILENHKDIMGKENKFTLCKEKFSKVKLQKNKSVGVIRDIKKCEKDASEMKDIFGMINSIQCERSSMLISPFNDWKVISYDLHNIKFNVTLKHLERLKNPLCENFIQYQTICKQIKKESTDFTAILQLGLNEIDIPLLYNTINSFGGVEIVHNNQNWKHIADQMGISKNTSRRVIKLEELYLKNILPYAMLPELEKRKLKEEVLNDANHLLGIPKYDIRKSMTVMNFHRLATNLISSYLKAEEKELEEKFWDIIKKGNRHFVGISAVVDITDEIHPIQMTKGKSWNFRNLFLHGNSALKYLGDVKGVSQPRLSFEGVFATSEWCVEPNYFHLLSYLHSGAHRIWYVLPASMKVVFEKVYSTDQTLITPNELLAKGISVERLIQREGEYVIIKPYCYYITISCGYSCSEVVSFAPLTWFNTEYFRSFKFNLTDKIFYEILLDCAHSCLKKRVLLDAIDVLLDKLKELKYFIACNISKLSVLNITRTVTLDMEEVDERHCSICQSRCFLMSVVQSKKKKEIVICIDDVMKMVASKPKETKKHNFVLHVVVNEEDIEKMIEKLKKKKK